MSHQTRSLPDLWLLIGGFRRLPKRDLARFRKWFVEYDAAAWDRQFEQDVAAGRLAKLAREALKDLRAGRTTGL